MPTMKELKERGDVPPQQAKLSKEDKEAWAADAYVFDLVAVEAHPEGDKGSYHTFTVDLAGDGYIFDLQDKGGRGVHAAALAEQLVGEPITGLQLYALSWNAGNAFLVIDEAGLEINVAKKGK